MKKPPKLSQQDRQIYLRHLKAKKRKHIKKAKKRKHIKKNRNKIRKQHVEKIEIVLPENFHLYNNYAASIQKINEIRKAVERTDIQLQYLDFDNMTAIHPTTALMLAAEVDVWRTTDPHTKLRASHENWNPTVRKLLCDMGFFNLLGLEKPNNYDSDAQDISYLEFMAGRDAEGGKARKLREMIEKRMETSLGIETRQALFIGLTEAIVNVHQHAYKNVARRLNKWWISASYQKSTRILSVLVYDRGQGIPNTLQREGKWESVRKLIPDGITKDHSKLIEIAMEQSQTPDSRTQTQEAHRGLGLKQLLNLIEDGNGELKILSGKGFCTFVYKSGEMKTKSKPLDIPLQGTLIEWEKHM